MSNLITGKMSSDMTVLCGQPCWRSPSQPLLGAFRTFSYRKYYSTLSYCVKRDCAGL